MREIRCFENHARILIDQLPGEGRNIRCAGLMLRFVFSGKERYYTGRRELTLSPGNFLILSPGTHYRFELEPGEKSSSLTLIFDHRFQYIPAGEPVIYREEDLDAELKHFSDWANSVYVYPLKLDAKYNLGHFCRYLEKEEQEQEIIGDYMHHCLISCYLVYRAEMAQHNLRLAMKQPAAQADVCRRLSLAREYIQANYEQKISLKDIANYSCLSVNHLIRTFSQVYLMTPHEYLKRVRLQRAQALLKDTDCSIQEISNTVGFDSTSSFIRLFREYFQVTPKKFKKVA